MEWGVCTVTPSCEIKATADLVSVGFATYYPRYESVEAIHGRIVKRARPLFPGYLFYELIGDLWRKLFGYERVTGVLMCDDEQPSRVSDEVVNELRYREGPEGVIQFDKKPRRYKPGTSVTIKHGVMVGFSGVVERLQSHDRVQVLLSMLGRGTVVSLREAEITAS